MRLSIILPTFDRPDLLAVQLEALAGQTWEEPWEVVVVDNGSNPRTVEVVECFRECLRELRYVEAGERRNVSYARNVGAHVARGAAFAFVDEDDEVAPGWLASMGSALADHPVVAARIDVDALNPSWVVGFRGRPQTDDLMSWYRVPSFRYATGTTLAVWRSAHEEIGGWDEGFWMTEDADYCFRLAHQGYEITFAPEAVVRYRYRLRYRDFLRQAMGYSTGAVAIYERYLPLGLPRPPRFSGLYGWGSVGRRLLSIRDRESYGDFVWHLGSRIGFIRGSIRHRMLILSE